MRRFFSICGVLAVLSGGAYWFFAADKSFPAIAASKESKNKEVRWPVNVIAAEMGDYTLTQEIVGQLQLQRHSRLGFALAGCLDATTEPMRVGQSVQAGTVLANLTLAM